MLWIFKVDHWISFAHIQQVNKGFLTTLDSALKLGTFIVGHSLTAADLILWGVIEGCNFYFITMYNWQDLCIFIGLVKNHAQFTNITRWYEYINSLPLVQKAVCEMLKEVKHEILSSATIKPGDNGRSVPRKDEGKFIDLPGAKDGEVVVRFPPEASGYDVKV